MAHSKKASNILSDQGMSRNLRSCSSPLMACADGLQVAPGRVATPTARPLNERP